MSGDGWFADAVCRQGDPDMWYPEGQGREGWVREAKRWCAACPVRPECLSYVLRLEGKAPVETRYGVWAGLTPRERYKAHIAAAGA